MEALKKTFDEYKNFISVSDECVMPLRAAAHEAHDKIMNIVKAHDCFPSYMAVEFALDIKFLYRGNRIDIEIEVDSNGIMFSCIGAVDADEPAPNNEAELFSHVLSCVMTEYESWHGLTMFNYELSLKREYEEWTGINPDTIPWDDFMKRLSVLKLM